jgi:N-acetylglutamate synthase-like GNAT family acetyltransferase
VRRATYVDATLGVVQFCYACSLRTQPGLWPFKPGEQARCFTVELDVSTTATTAPTLAPAEAAMVVPALAVPDEPVVQFPAKLLSATRSQQDQIRRKWQQQLQPRAPRAQKQQPLQRAPHTRQHTATQAARMASTAAVSHPAQPEVDEVRTLTTHDNEDWSVKFDDQVRKMLCSLWEVDHAAIGNSCQKHHRAAGFVRCPAIMIAAGTYDIDTEKNIGYVDYIGVDEQGCGYGRQFVAGIVATMKTLGIDYVYTFADTEARPEYPHGAVGFFQKCGFVPVPDAEHEFAERKVQYVFATAPTTNVTLMVLRLGATSTALKKSSPRPTKRKKSNSSELASKFRLAGSISPGRERPPSDRGRVEVQFSDREYVGTVLRVRPCSSSRDPSTWEFEAIFDADNEKVWVRQSDLWRHCATNIVKKK